MRWRELHNSDEHDRREGEDDLPDTGRGSFGTQLGRGFLCLCEHALLVVGDDERAGETDRTRVRDSSHTPQETPSLPSPETVMYCCAIQRLLEGLVCDAVIGPSDNATLYGTHCFQPEFLGRAVDMALAGLGEEVLDIGVLAGLIRALKENGGLEAQPADLVALAPHPAVGPLPAVAVGVLDCSFRFVQFHLQ